MKYNSLAARALASTALALGSLTGVSAAAAQGMLLPRPCIVEDQPRPRCAPDAPNVTRVSSDVRVRLERGVLHYEVEEVFVNRGGTVGEADYLFPLPRGAAFRDLKLEINGEMVGGETLDAGEARRIYEAIVRSRKDPALVEWMGHGLLRTRIFPVEAGSRRRIMVRFDVVAPREGSALRIDYFRGSRMSENPAVRGSRVERGAASLDGSVSFELRYTGLEQVGRPYSPTHELDVRERGAETVVSVEGSGRDVTVLLPLRRGTGPAITVLAHDAGEREDGFALITLTPPALTPRTMPRDVTIVIDVSGSMGGVKLRQAKEAANRVLGTLDEQDRFRVIDFSSDVRVFREAFVPATRSNLEQAREYVEDLRAEGGTNISGALDEALDGAASDARIPFVLFMTDGAPSVGERDPLAIAERAARARGTRRIVTFGVGADVNVSLIEQLALRGRGTAHFVRPEENVEEVVGVVASRIRQPVITDLRIRADGVRLERTMPEMPVDLFAGQDLVVLTRVDGSGRATLRFEGRSGNTPVSWTQEITFSGRERDNAFIPRLWATQRIGWLSAERRRAGGNTELDAELRELGERYGIPTELTSYFVKEPGMDLARLQSGTGAVDATAAGAPAPAAPRARFEAARSAQERRSARSLAAADQAAAGYAVEQSAANGVVARRAGNHVFHLLNGVWTDAALRNGQKRVKVEPYSAAYFALADAIPELREAFALGDRVIVAGRSIAIEVTEGGAARLTPAEVTGLREQW